MATRSVYSGKRVLVASPGAARGTNYTVTVENLFTGDTVSQRARTKKGKVVTALTMNSSGVLKTTIDDGRGNKTVEYSVGTADIQCCIAKLVHDAIHCTCKCDKCKEDLKLAEKIYLLLQAAVFAATNGRQTDANDMYRKAKEFCQERCACGC
jgi:hypothetical protein